MFLYSITFYDKRDNVQEVHVHSNPHVVLQWVANAASDIKYVVVIHTVKDGDVNIHL